MRVIWKYTLELDDEGQSTVLIPHVHQILHIGQQAGTVTAWVAVDPERAKTPVHFTVLGTGMEVPPDVRHLGTVLMPTGFVWHVYGQAQL